MLVELGIKDFAIIERINLGFGPGLNIFTGETGAGKSIIIDALSLVLGDRASADLIREGRDEAVVEAMFDVSDVAGVEGVLAGAGIEHSENLVIRRVVQRAGRNRIYINGSLATLVTLSEIGRFLLDIYGQSEHQSLTRPDEHAEILDAYAGLKILRGEMARAWREYAAARGELDALREKLSDAAERRDFLEFQLRELNDAELRAGEEAELEAEEKRLANAERIKRAMLDAEREIYSESDSVTEKLGRHLTELREAAEFDPAIKEAVENVESSLYQLEDAASFLRDHGESLEADPDSLDRVSGRLAMISRLRKKYSATVEELLEKQAAMTAELEEITGGTERVDLLEIKVDEARKKAETVAARLTEKRIEAADELKGHIERELADLGMEGSVFEPSVEADANPDGTLRLGEKGADRVRFLIAPNPGEGVKPLNQIASGGELSRIMLAIKRVSAAGRVPTLVFDEIDTGVGGKIAQAVGLKLGEVAGGHQVICITHLPQIAAFADTHYRVEKAPTGEGRTATSIRGLGPDERVEEISSMLGGMKVTETTRQHARELFDSARSLAEERKKRHEGGRPGAGGRG